MSVHGQVTWLLPLPPYLHTAVAQIEACAAQVGIIEKHSARRKAKKHPAGLQRHAPIVFRMRTKVFPSTMLPRVTHDRPVYQAPVSELSYARSVKRFPRKRLSLPPPSAPVCGASPTVLLMNELPTPPHERPGWYVRQKRAYCVKERPRLCCSQE